MAPLARANVDTDQIIPKQFLKSIKRTGFEAGLFYDWRKSGDFVLDRPEHQGAAVLVAGANFGCGSSREHAAWALQQSGLRAVIAPSFGDIFRNNCHKIGLLPVQLPQGRVRQLQEIASEAPETELTVDLESQTVSTEGFEARFEIDPFVKQCLLNGWDDIALALRHDDAIQAFERARPGWLPSVGAAR
jgi:3-isopropylmalate/(R)-2-methylmalate dehydratase small subunit